MSPPGTSLITAMTIAAIRQASGRESRTRRRLSRVPGRVSARVLGAAYAGGVSRQDRRRRGWNCRASASWASASRIPLVALHRPRQRTAAAASFSGLTPRGAQEGRWLGRREDDAGLGAAGS
jgi:hypothetical protein